MSFDKLIAKVKQAEDAVEARERALAADWRQVKSAWRAAWTPGRIVIAGLVGGFLAGRARPAGYLAGGGAMQLLSALSGLFASGSAQAAAGEAQGAANSAQRTAAAVSGDEATVAAAQARAVATGQAAPSRTGEAAP